MSMENQNNQNDNILFQIKTLSLERAFLYKTLSFMKTKLIFLLSLLWILIGCDDSDSAGLQAARKMDEGEKSATLSTVR